MSVVSAMFRVPGGVTVEKWQAILVSVTVFCVLMAGFAMVQISALAPEVAKCAPETGSVEYVGQQVVHENRTRTQCRAGDASAGLWGIVIITICAEVIGLIVAINART